MRLLTIVLFAILVTTCATTSFAFDVDGDGQEGLAESIHALQVVAGLNPPPPCNGPDEVLSQSRCWKDRNLGASRVAQSVTDSAAYGDLYQWGRQGDGHQNRNSSTTTTYSANDVPGHGYFIVDSSSKHDWRETRNDILWQGLGGVNNPCPQGFRIPTKAEWLVEINSWGEYPSLVKIFSTPLKLVVSGFRPISGNSISTTVPYYWSSDIEYGDGRIAALTFENGYAYMYPLARGNGCAVRCIKD